RKSWSPELAAVFLERFAKDETASDAMEELLRHVREQMPDAAQTRGVRRFCFVTTALSGSEVIEATAALDRAECSDQVRSLLRHLSIRTPLAAEAVVDALEKRSVHDLRQPLPHDLVEAIAARCRGAPKAVAVLQDVLKRPDKAMAHAMAASVVFALD